MNIKAIHIGLITSVLMHISFANESNEELIVSQKNNTLEIVLCHEKQCSNLKLSNQLKNDVDDGYEKLSLDYINSATPILVATLPGEGSANICSKIYIVNTTSKTLTKLNTKAEICNYTANNNTLISRYKDAATWTEDVYEISSNEATLKIRDKCTDCDQVLRTKFDESVVTKSIVSNNPDFKLRTPLSSKVKSKRAELYSAPNESSKTKMYLVKGDEVNLLDYTNIEQCWYQIRYISLKGNIDKWVKCSDLDI